MGTAVSGWRAADISGGGKGSERLDQDRLREFLADTKPRIANLANKVRVAGKQSNLLFLAESQLSQAIAHLRGSRKLFDAHHRARLHFAKWAEG